MHGLVLRVVWVRARLSIEAVCIYMLQVDSNPTDFCLCACDQHHTPGVRDAGPEMTSETCYWQNNALITGGAPPYCPLALAHRETSR